MHQLEAQQQEELRHNSIYILQHNPKMRRNNDPEKIPQVDSKKKEFLKNMTRFNVQHPELSRNFTHCRKISQSVPLKIPKLMP